MSAACYLTHFVDQNFIRKGKLPVIKRKVGTYMVRYIVGRRTNSYKMLGGLV
jgi:hypothetical protein